MTDLIYRGATHQRHETIRARVARALIYRGVRHDGRDIGAPAASHPIAMRYRGVAYALAQDAPRLETATAHGAKRRLAPELAFA